MVGYFRVTKYMTSIKKKKTLAKFTPMPEDVIAYVMVSFLKSLSDNYQ